MEPSEFFGWCAARFEPRLRSPDSDGQIRGLDGAIIYAANPNLIYLQATAMTEPLYLALFIWAVVYFNEFVQELPPSRRGAHSAILAP